MRGWLPPRYLPDDIPFDRWVMYVFDHPVLEPNWWNRSDQPEHREFWNDSANPARTLGYVTRLFRQPAFLMDRYTRPQIDQGLYLLVSTGCGEYMLTLRNTSLPWADRRACFDSMISLYSDLMAPLYGDDIVSDNQRYGPDRPNFTCYMWWDVMPLYGGMNHPDQERINDAVLHILRNVLQLRSEACLESALHGLGEWHSYLPDRTTPIVQDFLDRRTDISPALRYYAECALVGGVQ